MFKFDFHMALNKYLLKKSKYFDAEWYINRYSDVESAKIDPFVHYLLWGAREGRNPSDKFNTIWYVNNNQDVATLNINPLIHYLKFGKKQGRLPKPDKTMVERDKARELALEYHLELTKIESRLLSAEEALQNAIKEKSELQQRLNEAERKP